MKFIYFFIHSLPFQYGSMSWNKSGKQHTYLILLFLQTMLFVSTVCLVTYLSKNVYLLFLICFVRERLIFTILFAKFAVIYYAYFNSKSNTNLLNLTVIDLFLFDRILNGLITLQQLVQTTEKQNTRIVTRL